MKLLGAQLEVVVATGGAGGIAGHVKEIAHKVKGSPDDALAAIVGHTDNQGAHDYNLDLSRAAAPRPPPPNS